MNEEIIFDGENVRTLNNDEMIHQLRLDNKYLQLRINNLQSKIDKANKIIEKYKNTKTDDYVKVIEFYQEIRETLKEDK